MSETASTEFLWVGRFTGPKGEIAQQIIAVLAPAFPLVHFTLIGGPVTEAMRRSVPANVELTGFVENIQPWMQRADAVIGAGRVALEAMQAGKPILAVGENRYHGWVTAANISAARASNFGDCEQLHEIDMQQFSRDVEAFINGTVDINTAEYPAYLREYDGERVYRDVMQVYRVAAMDRYLKQFREIPVLTYHRVVKSIPEASIFNIYITVEELDKQLHSLQARGYTTVTFKEIAEGKQVKKPVILTFDDGYLDNYENLLPLLQRHQARAVIFALANRELQSNQWDIEHGEPAWPLMNDAQLLSCATSGHIEIGSHGVNHRRLPTLSSADVQHEITSSKKSLEKLLGTEVVSFAYPYGDYGQREVDAVRQAGYLFGVGTVNGPVSLARDRFRVRRINMLPNARLTAFRKKTSGWYLRYCRLKGKDF